MNRSESIGSLAKALGQAQMEFKPVSKNAKGYGYKYAPLDELIDKTKDALHKYGLSHSAVMEELDGSIKMECCLMHESGEFITSSMILKLDPSKKMSPMQQLGSSITYGRRYLLQSLLGVAAEEDTDDQPKPSQSKSAPQKPDYFSGILSEIKRITDNYTNKDGLKDLLAELGVKTSDELLKKEDPDKKEILDYLKKKPVEKKS